VSADDVAADILDGVGAVDLLAVAPRGRGPVTGGSSYERIYAVIRKVPRGRVTTYGTVARLAGLEGQARLVGYALSALRSGTSVPWHRVINAQGLLSLECAKSAAGVTQRLLLTREGVVVDAAGKVSLARFGWRVSRSGKRAGSRSPEVDAESSHRADDRHRPRLGR
jgi:methylated-DNA-protein-cysteine methyltransferase-like protein